MEKRVCQILAHPLIDIYVFIKISDSNNSQFTDCKS